VANKRLLIVEDDAVTRDLLQHVLGQAGYDVSAVRDGPDALNILKKNGLPHLVLLDLGLPGMHGFTVGELIKRMGDVPIIILTGEDSEEVKVLGIEQYADDYITKPFSVREVVARIQRVLSRISDFSYAQSPVMQIDEHLAIDFPNNQVWRDGQAVALTPIETSLLSVLIRNKGHIVPTATLIARVWPNEEVYEETLRVHITRLRGKLTARSDDLQYIRNERGVGYTFIFPGEPGV
jgi:DNA-binding response OmpR family regulator